MSATETNLLKYKLKVQDSTIKNSETFTIKSKYLKLIIIYSTDAFREHPTQAIKNK